jgi:hypothetical protein
VIDHNPRVIRLTFHSRSESKGLSKLATQTSNDESQALKTFCKESLRTVTDRAYTINDLPWHEDWNPEPEPKSLYGSLKAQFQTP